MGRMGGRDLVAVDELADEDGRCLGVRLGQARAKHHPWVDRSLQRFDQELKTVWRAKRRGLAADRTETGRERRRRRKNGRVEGEDM